MKKEIKILTLCYLFVLLFVMLSGKFEGILQIIIYIFAFIAPVFAGVYLSKEDDKIKISEELRCFGIRKEDLFISLLLAFPVLLIILAVSYLTSLILFVTVGKESGMAVSGNPAFATVIHALLPAILEELAFRYLPIKLIGKKSPRVTVFASAFFFSLIHRSFFSIPYAFAAGVLFMAIDLAAQSVLPSVIIHFLNNALALMTMGVYGFTLSTSWAFLIVGALSLVSAVILLFERRRLAVMAKTAFAKGEGYSFSKEPLFFAAAAVIIAISELIV